MKGNLPPSQAVGDMIALPVPCGNTVYYPANLVLLATQQKYSVFQTMSFESGNAYLCTTQPDRIRIRLINSPLNIAKIYESLPWREDKIINGGGEFLYKAAPSLQEMNSYFDDMAKNQS